MENLHSYGISKNEIYAIYLDDHKIFQSGVRKLTNRYFKNLLIDTFQHPHPALKRIEYCLNNNIDIDLIISDIRHPEPNGFIFSKMVRTIEKNYQKKIPILIISMYITDPLKEELIPFISQGIWNKALPKAAAEHEIIETISELVKEKSELF